ncbi:MAG TPA: arylamine N-acetyltransferase [Usitatibacter sp.]|nr:arylamine N-acetyltransferase [Usitatibacter sp.]
MNLDAYLARIGLVAPASADLPTLRELHRLHTTTIPFENLSPFLGEKVLLDIASLEEKLVRRKRGGWCFEHNLFFTHVLREIGYEVKTLAARVRWNVAPNVTTARSHMVMLVLVEGERFIADVGFGGLTLTAPLHLQPGLEQQTPHEPHRLRLEGDKYTLEARIAGEWQALYVFDLHEQLQADYEVSNWYLANFPQSQFVTGIIAARADADCRHALRNTRYAIHYRGGETQRRHLGSVEELKAVLSGPMRIPLPAHPELDARLQKVVDANPEVKP